jgi:prepilin-type N-terminal cleavage/methylation domain-containing protein
MKAATAQTGFTLIELIIAMAIIGTLAAVALPSYVEYAKTANISKVNVHFETAKRLTRATYVKAFTRTSIGLTASPPETVAEWLVILSRGDSLAPGGGPAFDAGEGDSYTGQVGVQVTGTFAGGNAVVTLTRPAYEALTLDTFSIVAATVFQ